MLTLVVLCLHYIATVTFSLSGPEMNGTIPTEIGQLTLLGLSARFPSLASHLVSLSHLSRLLKC